MKTEETWKELRTNSLTGEDFSSWKTKFIMKLLKTGKKQMKKGKHTGDSKLLGLL